MQVTTIGLDLAKNIFQVHGIDANGKIAFNRSLRRSHVLAFFKSRKPCLVGIEACGTSHYWAREISNLGHHVKLIPPAYVKPYVKRGKSDAVDAEAICEAVTRQLCDLLKSRPRSSKQYCRFIALEIFWFDNEPS